jgi:hypothetical protein
MGHEFRKQSSAVAGLRAAEIVTRSSAIELVDAAAHELHAVMRLYRRDRWFFRRGQEADCDGVLNLSTIWGGVSRLRETKDLMCTLRVRTSLGTPVGIDANFYVGQPRPVSEIGLARHEDVVVAVRIGIADDRRHNRGWPRAAPAALIDSMRDLPRTFVRARDLKKAWLQALRGALHFGEGATWWIDPRRTPPDVTRFALLVFLWQARVLDLSGSGQADREALDCARTFVRQARPTGIDEAQLYQTLVALRDHYTLPQDWKELRRYLGRVVRTVRAKEAKRPDPIADGVGVSRRTVYRWRSEGRLPSFSLPLVYKKLKEQTALSSGEKASLEAATQLADRRRTRKEVQDLLMERGRGREAARKFIQRRLRAGESVRTMLERQLQKEEE